jgi:hypothetical protein
MGCCNQERMLFNSLNEPAQLLIAESDQLTRLVFKKKDSTVEIKYNGLTALIAVCPSGREYEFNAKGAVQKVHDCDAIVLLSDHNFSLSV